MDNKKPHNNFFVYLFSQTPIVRGALNELAPNLAEGLNLETLEKDDTTYVDDSLREFYSDIVYNCEQKSKETIKISFLFEHKSIPQKYPHLQLLDYMLGIWRYNINNQQKLTPIIPIIFYHGERAWQEQSFMDYFVHLDERYHRFLPSFDYHLIDLNEYSDEDILKLKTRFLLNALLAFKHKNDGEYVKRHYLRLFYNLEQEIDSETGSRFIHHLSVYLVYSAKLNSSTINEMIDKLPSKVGDKVMTTYENIINTGIKKKSIQVFINLLVKGMDKAFAAEIADLDNKTAYVLEEKIQSNFKDKTVKIALAKYFIKKHQDFRAKDIAEIISWEEAEVKKLQLEISQEK